MNRQDAEKIITEYLKPIFGFALKRCKNAYDAEDLSQDIVLKAFRALLIKDDIGDVSKFIWTIAHNTLSNYYRTAAKSVIGLSIDEIAEIIADPDSMLADDDNADTIRRLQSEIAYLSRLQRRIVIAYYFENRKQGNIAKELGIPLGTVKWHLFEAKKELKRGMDTMRKTSELKFNPINFTSVGINGSIGTKSCDEFFRSALSQNICYCVRNEAKTVNEIADALGVSPVYVETEVDFLEEYGFLKQTGDRYIVNFIISEPTAELLTLQDTMYKKAAGLFADELYDELVNSGILDDENIFCNTLVDRIVTGYPKGEAMAEDSSDKMLDTSELFHLWVIEGPQAILSEIPFDKTALNVIFTDELERYRTRKVRILNGAHTAMIPYAMLRGIETVGDCMEDETMREFVTGCVYEEIIPTLDLPKEELVEYAENVFERFRNPYIRHLCASISLNSISKFRVRVLPSVLEYIGRTGEMPQRLLFSFAKLIEFYQKGTPADDDDIIAYIRAHSLQEILGNVDFWGEDLAFLYDEVKKYADS